MRLLDPSIDYVFKVLFKDPDDEPRLIAMLTAILEPAVPIVAVRVLNPEIPPDVATAKSIVLDLRVEFRDGRQLFAEMETWPRASFPGRFLFSWARLHVQQLDRGEHYTRLQPTIGIAWIAGDGRFERIAGSRVGHVHSRYRINEVTTGRELTDHLDLHLLELPKRRSDSTLSESLGRWARFFDHPSETELRELAREDEVMAETVKKLERVSADEIHFQNAEARRMGEWRDRYEKTFERDEGKAEGRAEGESAKLRELVRSMLANGVTRDVVARIAGISSDQVDALASDD